MSQSSSNPAAQANSAEVDYFAVLGLPRRFDIDLAALEKSYVELSKKSHPDALGDVDAKARLKAAGQTVLLNQAYKTLRKDQSRAEHLLALHGVRLHDKEVLDPAFLTEILEMHEELLAAQQQDPERAAQMEGEMQARQKAAMTELRQILRGDSPNGTALAKAKQILISMRYISRFLEACQPDDGL